MTTTLNRSDIQKITNDPKVVRGLESFFAQVADNTDVISANVAATTGINNATVVTLSANDAFVNERVLQVASPLAIDVSEDGYVTVGFQSPFFINGGYRLTLNLLADTDITFASSGTVITSTDLANLGNYLNDAAAAAGGVPVNGLYRNGSVLMIRVS